MSSQIEVIASLDDLFGTPCRRRYRTVGPLPVRRVSVRIRSLTDAEVSDYQTAIVTSKESSRQARMRDANARLIVLCLVDADGNQLCEPKHVPQILQWDAADSLWLYDECVRHVGLRKADIEELVKNSDAAQAAEPSTD